jgi:hypothetical protein
VKLPPLNTLGEISSFMKELNSVLSQTVLLSQVKGRAEVRSFDHGSLWIEILVGAPLAVTFLSCVVESSLKLRRLKLDGDRKKIELEMMQLKKESIKDYVAKQKSLTDKLVEDEASSLAGMLNPKLDGEQMNGLRESIRMIDKLIQKGTEIYPSLPDTQKQELPSFDYKKLIAPTIKALTDGTDDNDPADEG